jgi:PKHD-type hydroxylase
MYHREFIEPYYLEKLNRGELREIQKYISNLSDSDYKHNEFEHYDGFEEKQYLNNQFYRYDLKNLFEFQLIKYYVGGNYNWHCDYGIAPKRGMSRKLSMSIQLTPPEEYHGGELQIVDYANHTLMIPGDMGTVIVFDSKLPHKVWPVVWGQRISLVGWANGPRLR